MKYSYPEIRKLCLKPDEVIKPIYARYVTHSLSTFLIWLFQDAPLTPNVITLASLITAFLAIPFFITMSPISVFIGALLIEFYYVLDAVDGQWARFKNMKSFTGAFFDAIINYAIQPPLLFAASWGVFNFTQNPFYLLLGFLAAFSTLWVLLIWNVKASVLLASRRSTEQPEFETEKSGPLQSSPIRWLFGWLHKSLVFPWFMYVLSLASLSSLLWGGGFLKFTFRLFLLYYGFAGPVIAILITTHWILTKKIDQEIVTQS